MVQKAFARTLRKLLSLDDSAERLALAFAVGVFVTFTPFLGFHTLLAFVVAFLFGLNRAAVFLGLFANNPWTLVPYYTAAIYLGASLMGVPAELSVPDIGWSELWQRAFWLQIFDQWRLLMPMAVGSTILAFFSALLSYPVVLFVIKRGRAALGHERLPEAAG